MVFLHGVDDKVAFVERLSYGSVWTEYFLLNIMYNHLLSFFILVHAQSSSPNHPHTHSQGRIHSLPSTSFKKSVRPDATHHRGYFYFTS